VKKFLEGKPAATAAVESPTKTAAAAPPTLVAAAKQ
jgi:hypothetical protein